MRIFIDCEWNDHRGELISMALIADDGCKFYEVLECIRPSKWVAANVMPVLNKDPVPKKYFITKLRDFLQPYSEITLVADWPEDIERFCAALIVGPGERIGPGRINCIIDSELFIAQSEQPHNALADAESIKAVFVR